MQIELTKWICESSGEEYYSDVSPTEKMIGSEKFIEVTQNFKQVHFIRFSSLRKNGILTKDIEVQRNGRA